MCARLANRLLALGGRHEAFAGDSAPQHVLRSGSVCDAQDNAGSIFASTGFQHDDKRANLVRPGTDGPRYAGQGTGDPVWLIPDYIGPTKQAGPHHAGPGNLEEPPPRYGSSHFDRFQTSYNAGELRGTSPGHRECSSSEDLPRRRASDSYRMLQTSFSEAHF